jgi:hypothetical protein
MGRKIFSKKIVLERNKIWAAVFQLLGALNLPPSPSALFCPASALPARGFFLRTWIHCLFQPGVPTSAGADGWLRRGAVKVNRAGRLSDNGRRRPRASYAVRGSLVLR